MAPHNFINNAQIGVLSPSVLASPASRLSLDPTLGRRGAVDGGWWPHSRNASVELPVLVSSLNAEIAAALRLGVDARDWDDIPRRLTVGSHAVRVGRFADVNHKIIVTLARGSTSCCWSYRPKPRWPPRNPRWRWPPAAGTAARPREIRPSSGIEHETRANPPRTVPDPDHLPVGQPNRRTALVNPPSTGRPGPLPPRRTGRGVRPACCPHTNRMIASSRGRPGLETGRRRPV